jgi:hypothetical protein
MVTCLCQTLACDGSRWHREGKSAGAVGKRETRQASSSFNRSSGDVLFQVRQSPS